ncbi:hypothetical protein RE9414_02540 [Prescottella equi]|nr:hypothetical protein RE9414_02540 [Prescottella equi]
MRHGFARELPDGFKPAHSRGVQHGSAQPRNPLRPKGFSPMDLSYLSEFFGAFSDLFGAIDFFSGSLGA